MLVFQTLKNKKTASAHDQMVNTEQERWLDHEYLKLFPNNDQII